MDFTPTRKKAVVSHLETPVGSLWELIAKTKRGQRKWSPAEKSLLREKVLEHSKIISYAAMVFTRMTLQSSRRDRKTNMLV